MQLLRSRSVYTPLLLMLIVFKLADYIVFGQVNIQKIFENDQIVGDLLDEPPASCLFLKFGCHIVEPGQEMTPEKTKMEPTVGTWGHNPDTLYTLLCIDPDALSRANPEYRSVVHWMVTNIPTDDIKQGDTNVAYIGPSPPKDTGLHRYVFSVFEQIGGKINVTNLQYQEYLGNQYAFKFSVKDFIQLYRLRKNPVAGNYFQAQYVK